jgi:iron(III) transport system permease protein
VPPYILAVAWIQLANPTTGLVNRATRALGVGAPLDVYGHVGIILVLAASSYPLVLATAAAALERVDPALEEAARIAGARPLVVLRDITLPICAPAVGAAFALATLQAAASFGVPYLLGAMGQSRVPVLSTAIYEAVSLGSAGGDARAAALALLLLALAGLGFGAQAALRGRATVGGKASRPSQVRLGPLRPLARGALCTLALVAVLLPLVTVALASLMRNFGTGLAWSNLTLANYTSVLGQARVLDAALRSLWLAALAAALVVLVGGLLAYARRRMHRLRAARALAALAELPYAVPGTVLGIALLVAFSREVRVIAFDQVTLRFALLNTPWLLLVGYAVKELALGVRALDAALGQLDPALEEAARVAGATPLRAVRDVVAPLLRPAAGAAFLMVFLPLLSEVTLSILLFGPTTETLGTVLFELQSYADPPAAAVVATLLVLAVALGQLVLARLPSRSPLERVV